MKKINYFLLFILVLSSVNAYDLSTNLLHYYNMNETSGAINDRIIDTYCDSSNVQVIATYGVSGIDNQACDFSSTTNYVQWNYNANCFTRNADGNFTVSIWIYPHDIRLADTFNRFAGYYTFSREWTIRQVDSPASFRFYTSSNGNSNSYTESNTLYNNSAWFNVIGVFNKGNRSIYINGKREATTTGITIVSPYSMPTVICGQPEQPDTTGNCNQIFDNAGYWIQGLTSEEISIYYNNTLLGCNPVDNPSSCLFPFLSLSTNLINNTINWHNQKFNYTYNATCTDCLSDLFNISFYNNGDKNITLLNVNLSNVNQFNITLPDNYEGYYNFSFTVNNSEFERNSGVYIYKVDLLQPRIMSSFINNTIYEPLDLITSYFNFSDVNLFAYNITLKNGSSVLENYFVSNLSVDFAENLSSRYAIYDGNYSFLIQSWDSHTAKSIKNYKIDSLTNGIEIEDKIKIYSDDITKFDTVKNKDRYEFNIDFVKGKTWKTVNIESLDNLVYLPKSQYKGHFVDFINKKWVDFESSDLEDIQINRISDKKFEVKIRSKNKDSMNFKSIGDLNYNYLIYYYSIETIIIPPSNVTTASINLSGLEKQLKNLSGSTETIGLFIFASILLIAGIISRFYILWCLSGMVTFIVALQNGQRFLENGILYQSASFYAFLILSLGLLFLGIYFTIMKIIEDKKENNKDFYNMEY